MVFGNISTCQQQESHKQKEYMVTALWGGGGAIQIQAIYVFVT